MNQPLPLLPSLQRSPANKASAFVRKVLILFAHQHISLRVFLPKIHFQPRIQADTYSWYSLFPWRFSWIYTFLLNLKSSKQRLFRLFNIHIYIYITEPQNVLKTAICELVYMFSFFLLFLKCFKLVTSKTKIFQLFNQRLEAISWPLIILLLLTGHKEKTAWRNHLIQNYFSDSCTYWNQI